MPRPSTTRHRGFTLVELLVVILIMMIVVALTVSVGRYVMERSARQETEATQQIVMTAIDAYYDEMGEYPEGDGNTDELLNQLEDSRRARELLEELPEKAVQDDRLIDGFKQEMRYYDGVDDGQYAGFGGKPVLISAGPDREFGSGDGPEKDDNIRSDEL